MCTCIYNVQIVCIFIEFSLESNTPNSTIVVTEEGMRWSGEDDGTFSVYFI